MHRRVVTVLSADIGGVLGLRRRYIPPVRDRDRSKTGVIGLRRRYIPPVRDQYRSKTRAMVPSSTTYTPETTQASSSTYVDAPSGPWIELNHWSMRRIWVGRKRLPVREDRSSACSAADMRRRERPSAESWRAIATTRCSWGWGRSVRRSVPSR